MHKVVDVVHADVVVILWAKFNRRESQVIINNFSKEIIFVGLEIANKRFVMESSLEIKFENDSYVFN